MKFSIDKNLLVHHLKKVAAIIGNNVTIPVLGNIYLEIKESKLILRATNLEVSIKTEIEVIAEKEGVTTLPSRTFTSMIYKLPDGIISFDNNDSLTTIIKCNSVRFKINGMDPKEFPEEETMKDVRKFVFNKKIFRKTLQKISYAASTDESRYVLNGILLSVRGDVFTSAATDGRRLALVEEELDIAGELDGDVILPSSSVAEIVKSLDFDGEITVKLSDSKASFITDDTVIITKLVEGTYPNFRHVIPEAFEYTAVIPRIIFNEALERASIVVLDPEEDSVFVEFADNKAILTANSQMGESSEAVDISYEGPTMTILFNPQFLSDPLKNLDCDDFVMKLNDPDSPLAIGGEEGFMCVIMPIRT
ncbi:MAG: DNA polymerase III subunit beta [Verrucomicrobiota bacterium]|nr:DNA polymerase III subunit beta [Verrucomicrobiota bacterium]